MPRVLLLCAENVSCDRLRQVFQSHTEFEIVAGIKDDAAYPYWGPLVARLAQQYLSDGQTWRASVVVHQYRKLFPEDPLVRDALQPSANPAGLLPTPARVPPTAPPR